MSLILFAIGWNRCITLQKPLLGMQNSRLIEVEVNGTIEILALYMLKVRLCVVDDHYPMLIPSFGIYAFNA